MEGRCLELEGEGDSGWGDGGRERGLREEGSAAALVRWSGTEEGASSLW